VFDEFLIYLTLYPQFMTNLTKKHAAYMHM